MKQADIKKMEILSSIEGFKLNDTDDPAIKTMDLGDGHLLHCNVTGPTDSWNIIKGEDSWNIYSDLIPFTYTKDARKLTEAFKKALNDAFDDGSNVPERCNLDNLRDNAFKIDNVDNDIPKQHIGNEPDVKSKIQPVKGNKGTSLLDIIEKYIKNDLVQIFGDTGTGKTSISMRIANDARNEKRKVLYVDTEHNTTDEQAAAVKANGIEYIYIPDFEDMYQYVRKIPAYDVVIIDSMGLPVLNLYASMNMKERGDALLKMIALTAFLKKYANKNKSLIVVTNQPESDFNKDPKTARRPFGDKSQFNTKEIFRTVFANNGRLENKTTIILKAYRSRSCGMDSRICNVEISNSGVEVVV